LILDKERKKTPIFLEYIIVVTFCGKPFLVFHSRGFLSPGTIDYNTFGHVSNMSG
jgi:hypothetical protein